MAFDKWFEGLCPECALEERLEEMSLNRDDLLECPTCRLQICLPSPMDAVVLRRRGRGEFRSLGAERYRGSNYSRSQMLIGEDEKTLFRAAGAYIDSAERLRFYLEEAIRDDVGA